MSDNRRLTFWRITALTLSIVAVAFMSVMPQGSNDFWLQAKVGEIILQDKAIPDTVLFPFTEIRDNHFNAHEWVPSILFYKLITIFGEDKLPFVLGFGGLALFYVLATLANTKGEGNTALAMAFGLYAVCIENYRHTLRPELISLLLLGVFLHLIELFRKKPSTIYWLSILAITVSWANTHGSFILAPIITSLLCFGDWIDRIRNKASAQSITTTSPKVLGILAAAVFAATLVNPLGWELIEFVVSFSQSALSKQFVMEWFPTLDKRLIHIRGIQIGLLALGISAFFLILNIKNIRTADLLIFLLFAALALKTNRFLVYVGIAGAFTLPALLPAMWKTEKYQIRIYVGCALFSATLIGAIMNFGNASEAFPHKEFSGTKFTDPMIKELSNPAVTGNVLNSYGLGAELVYRFYPRLRPSIDSRIDSYGDDYVLFHETLFVNDELLREFITRYDVRHMLLNHREFEQLQALPLWMDHDWSVQIADRTAVFLKRIDHSN